MDVGIREFREKLSSYLERASKGEVIRITDRGQAKALLTPIRDASVLQRGIDEGWLQRGRAVAPRPVARAQGERRVLQALRLDRDGR
ncbi:MAG: type II toxin-antitoxin system prevent-host-death family antitoxin [Myxococcota bacterium]